MSHDVVDEKGVSIRYATHTLEKVLVLRKLKTCSNGENVGA